MAKKKASNKQPPLNFSGATLSWPPNDQFPLNLPDEQRNVLQEISKDINSGHEYLIVTGFTSLAHLIDFFGSGVDLDKIIRVRIILGFEPEVRQRKSWGGANLEKEIKDYWLERGYSILKGGNVIKMVELVKSGKIQFRILDHLHAKLYVGDSHAILGSANFSKNGLTKQLEANIRVPNHAHDLYERRGYEEIRRIANNYYKRGNDYTEGIQDLLQKLLKVTTWKEALARAIAELLEGNWFKEFPELYERLNQITLWPSQRYALGQAMYILQNQGCALIADPTGSGKTKLITTLQLLLIHWLWESGRKNKSYPVIICPPLVQDNWRQESIDTRFMQASPISTGLLSYARNSGSKNTLKGIEVAGILTIDEAHHFLNATSCRSRRIAKHNSDFIILSTATPISRKAKDLLRLIEILDVDNLSDEDLKSFKKLRRGRTLKAEELDDLRSYVSKFLVRRTKAELGNA